MPSRTLIQIVLGLATAGAAALFLYANASMATPLLAGLFNAVVLERGSTASRAIAYGPGPRHKLDIYRLSRGANAPPDDKSPIAIFFYGGSWKQGERGQYEFVGRALAKKGATVVIPDYRLFPEVRFPAFMDDAADAYAWVAKNVAKRPDGTYRPIVLIGHSAGAHMAALLALNPSYLAKRGSDLPKPAALIGLAGPYSFDPTTWPTTKDVFADVKDPDSARPVAFAANGGPPTLLMHGLKDDTAKISNMRDLTRALKAAGTDVVSLELENIGHLSILTSIAKPLRGWAPVLQAMREFMMRHATLELIPPPKPTKPERAPVLPPVDSKP